MPNPPLPQPAASSGIQTDSSGQRHIPESVRADGSIRKEIKVRPGYRPPEDVALYKNRTADGWKSRVKAGVPGAEASDAGDETLNNTSTAKSKNSKRRDARKKAKSTDKVDGPKEVSTGGSTSQISSTDAREVTSKGDAAKPDENSVVDKEAELEKQARNLKKKLRQAKELQNKKESGEALLPEQFAKVIKIQELTRQLDALGFDSEGARKSSASAEHSRLP